MNCLDEHDYCEMMDSAVSKAASKTKRSHSLCHLPIDKERAGDVSYLAQVTLDIFKDNRPMDEASTRRRVLLLQSWENKLHKDFGTTADFIDTMTSLAGGKSWISADARKLRRVRRKNKWTQGRLAEELGISQQLVSAIEKGASELPEKVATWLGKR